MEKLAIEGGAPLCGEVAISGAKNAALPILCAGLLTAEEYLRACVLNERFRRCPEALVLMVGFIARAEKPR